MFKVGHQRMCGVRMHKIDVVIMTPFGRIGFVVNPERASCMLVNWCWCWCWCWCWLIGVGVGVVVGVGVGVG